MQMSNVMEKKEMFSVENGNLLGCLGEGVSDHHPKCFCFCCFSSHNLQISNVLFFFQLIKRKPVNFSGCDS